MNSSYEQCENGIDRIWTYMPIESMITTDNIDGKIAPNIKLQYTTKHINNPPCT